MSAPRTSGETFDGSASPYPLNPLHFGDLKIVARKTQRELAGSEDGRINWVRIPRQFRRTANRRRPACLTYQPPFRYTMSPSATDSDVVWMSFLIACKAFRDKSG